jgi:enoyl-CoA hydratase/carnithine racemase
MSFASILYAAQDGIATVTLNRPEKLNAYTSAMGEELCAAFDRAREDTSVRAVILTGAGRGFCAGVDLEHLKAHSEGRSQASGSAPRLGEERFLKTFPLELLEYPKPVIAAVNGPAIGVGVTMILPCDVRLAADTAKLGLTFAKLGILPGLGSTHLLPRLVGMGRAQELVLSARVILAPEAAAIGLVNRAVPADSLLGEARALAGKMAECPPAVLAVAKRALHFGAGATMEQAMRNEEAQSAALRANSRPAAGTSEGPEERPR